VKFLVVVFLGMFAYGMWVGIYGAAGLALLMAGFVQLARGRFAREDAAWEQSSANAKEPKSVDHALCDYECECMRDTL